MRRTRTSGKEFAEGFYKSLHGSAATPGATCCLNPSTNQTSILYLHLRSNLNQSQWLLPYCQCPILRSFKLLLSRHYPSSAPHFPTFPPPPQICMYRCRCEESHMQHPELQKTHHKDRSCYHVTWSVDTNTGRDKLERTTFCPDDVENTVRPLQ